MALFLLREKVDYTWQNLHTHAKKKTQIKSNGNRNRTMNILYNGVNSMMIQMVIMTMTVIMVRMIADCNKIKVVVKEKKISIIYVNGLGARVPNISTYQKNLHCSHTYIQCALFMHSAHTMRIVHVLSLYVPLLFQNTGNDFIYITVLVLKIQKRCDLQTYGKRMRRSEYQKKRKGKLYYREKQISFQLLLRKMTCSFKKIKSQRADENLLSLKSSIGTRIERFEQLQISFPAREFAQGKVDHGAKPFHTRHPPPTPTPPDVIFKCSNIGYKLAIFGTINAI